MLDVGSQGHLISCLREYTPQWSQGIRLPCLFRDLTRQARRYILFVPSKSYQRWSASYTFTDEPWEEGHGLEVKTVLKNRDAILRA